MKTKPKTMEEARDSLRVSPPTLYKLINSGKLKTYKIGRRRFTTDVALAELISDLEKGAAI